MSLLESVCRRQWVSDYRGSTDISTLASFPVIVALTGPIDKTTGMVMNLAELKRVIKSNVLDLVDHKNIDQDVPYFRNVVR